MVEDGSSTNEEVDVYEEVRACRDEVGINNSQPPPAQKTSPLFRIEKRAPSPPPHLAVAPVLYTLWMPCRSYNDRLPICTECLEWADCMFCVFCRKPDLGTQRIFSNWVKHIVVKLNYENILKVICKYYYYVNNHDIINKCLYKGTVYGSFTGFPSSSSPI